MSKPSNAVQEAAQIFHHVQAQAAELPQGARITTVGLTGAGASALLQNVSLGVSIGVAVITFLYMCVKLYETRTFQRIIHREQPRTRKEDGDVRGASPD